MSGITRTPTRGEPGFWFLVALLTLLGLVLRAWNMTAQNLWLDEVETARIALLPLPELMRGLRGETAVLPTSWLSLLYFATLRTALHVPYLSVDGALRLVSVAAGSATIPALAWTGRRLLPDRTVLAATFILAISPFHVWYSQEVRPYALLVLLAVLAIGFFQRALRDGRRADWAAFAAAAALALYTHPTALVLPIVCGITVLVVAWPRPRTLRPAFVSFAAIGLAYAPAIALIRARGANEIADPRGATLFDLPYALYAYTVGFSFGPSTAELHVDPRAAIAAAAPAIALAVALFGVVGLAGLIGVVRRWRPAANGALDDGTATVADRVLLISWLVLPLVIALVSALASGNPFNPRYAIIAFPALVLALGAGVTTLAGLAPLQWRRAAAGLVLAAVALVSIVSLHNLATDPRYAKEDCRGLGAILAHGTTGDDLIVVNAYYMQSAVRYYYPGAAKVVGYEEPQGSDARERITADLRGLADGHPHVWLVLSRAFDRSLERLLTDVLGSLMVADGGRHTLPGISAMRFTSRAAAPRDAIRNDMK